MNLVRTVPSALALLRLASARHLAASVVVLVGLSALEGAGLLLLLPLLALVGVESGGGAAESLVAAVRAAFAAVGVRPTLGTILGLYVAIIAVQSSLQKWQGRITTHIELEVVTSLRRRLYHAMSGVRWEFFARRRSSDFLHALSTEIARVGAASHYSLDLCTSAAAASVYLGLAFFMSPLVTALVVTIGLVLGQMARTRFVRTRALGERQSTTGAGLQAAIAEHLAGMKTVKAYGAETRQVDVFNRLLDETAHVRLASAIEYGRFRQMTALGSTAGLAVVVYVSFGLLAVPAAELLVLLFLFARLLPRLTGLYERAQMLAGEIPAFERVTDMERQCLEAAEPPFVREDQVSLRREIRMEGVTFRYEGQAAPAAADVDLAIAARTTTAIVGPSGAGKSTIADLLLGLVVPERGRIVVDDAALEPEALGAWRRLIGYVPQETLLFHATVRENLLWARPDASDSDVWDALRLAAADEFVASLPRGLDTTVGDRGVLLSGGERQRLSLARAMLRRPELLILDEATSSLDSENEVRIQRAIEGLHAQMTIVVITHRLSTIRNADVVYVIDGGRVVEAGTWRALTSRPGGRFLGLCRSQGIFTAAVEQDQTVYGTV